MEPTDFSWAGEADLCTLGPLPPDIWAHLTSGPESHGLTAATTSVQLPVTDAFDVAGFPSFQYHDHFESASSISSLDFQPLETGPALSLDPSPTITLSPDFPPYTSTSVTTTLLAPSPLFPLAQGHLTPSLASPYPPPPPPQPSSSSRKRRAEAEDPDEESVVALKRQRNTMAARRYRQKRLDRISELEDAVGQLTSERDELRLKLARQEAETAALRDVLRMKSGT